MLIKACLNGSRNSADHPALPLSPEEIARAALDAVAAGAGALHFHPRRSDGMQVLDAATIGAAVAAVRAACPGVPVGVSTLVGIAPDVAERLALIRGWTTRPDFASVNLQEDDALDVCAALWANGVGAEAGLATAADAGLLVAHGLADRCVRLLLEPEEGDVAAAIQTVAAIEAVLDEAQVTAPRLLHGMNATAWPLLDAALARGYDTRIGLEDVLVLPNGTLAHDNAHLVAAAWERARCAGRN